VEQVVGDGAPAAQAEMIRARARARAVRVRVVRALGWTLVWLGLLTLGFVVHQVWITSWFARQHQAVLATERLAYFADAEPVEAEVTVEGSIVPQDEPAPEAEVLALPLVVESAPELHSAFALIRISALENLAQGWNVVEGVDVSDLKTGAGHIPATPLPGQPGNSVISGHRTTYGAPFNRLDELVPGDRIEVDTAIGTHVYEMRTSVIVAPADAWVLEPRQGAWLTLTTCNPEYSARERLVILAELVEGPNAEVIGMMR
jgi:sortase A